MIQLIKIYKILLAHYSDPHWWPARTPFEVIVGAILTQNTAWVNVEKAIANFGDSLSPYFIEGAGAAELAEIIRPAGFFNQKVEYLKAVTSWFAQYGYDAAAVRRAPLSSIRAELLSVKGVGQETADSILLYAFDFATFVVDAYTVRLCGRYPIDVGNGNKYKYKYNTVKAYFESHLPQSIKVYNDLHALIVINAKEHCRKKPSCAGCPLNDTCAKLKT